MRSAGGGGRVDQEREFFSFWRLGLGGMLCLPPGKEVTAGGGGGKGEVGAAAVIFLKSAVTSPQHIKLFKNKINSRLLFERQ